MGTYLLLGVSVSLPLLGPADRRCGLRTMKIHLQTKESTLHIGQGRREIFMINIDLFSHHNPNTYSSINFMRIYGMIRIDSETHYLGNFGDLFALPDPELFIDRGESGAGVYRPLKSEYEWLLN